MSSKSKLRIGSADLHLMMYSKKRPLLARLRRPSRLIRLRIARRRRGRIRSVASMGEESDQPRVRYY